jgi:hypothetical protein
MFLNFCDVKIKDETNVTLMKKLWAYEIWEVFATAYLNFCLCYMRIIH